jgi:hypothetical protein
MFSVFLRESGMIGRTVGVMTQSNDCRSNETTPKKHNELQYRKRHTVIDHSERHNFYIFNIHDVQLIIIFISLTKIKDIVENLDELCFQCSCASMFT